MPKPFLLAILLIPLTSIAQLVPRENEVEEPVPQTKVRGKIVPIIWKAAIGRRIILIPLQEVEFVGMQEYKVDGQAYVRELTICSKSRGFIRVYYLEKEGMVTGELGESAEDKLKTADRAGEVQERTVGIPPVLPNVPYQRSEAVIKNYPTTTHKTMMEYRVESMKTLDTLYESLETALLNYHGSDLIEDQREGIIDRVKVSDSSGEK